MGAFVPPPNPRNAEPGSRLRRPRSFCRARSRAGTPPARGHAHLPASCGRAADSAPDRTRTLLMTCSYNQRGGASRPRSGPGGTLQLSLVEIWGAVDSRDLKLDRHEIRSCVECGCSRLPLTETHGSADGFLSDASAELAAGRLSLGTAPGSDQESERPQRDAGGEGGGGGSRNVFPSLPVRLNPELVGGGGGWVRRRFGGGGGGGGEDDWTGLDRIAGNGLSPLLAGPDASAGCPPLSSPFYFFRRGFAVSQEEGKGVERDLVVFYNRDKSSSHERVLAQDRMLRGGEASAEEEEEADRPQHDRRAHELRAPDPHRLRRDARGPAAVGVHAGADAVEGSERQRQEQRVIAPQGMRKSLETQSLISWHGGRNPSAPPPLHTKHLSPHVPRIPLIPSGAGQLQHPRRRSAFRSRVPTRTFKISERSALHFGCGLRCRD